MHPVTHTARWTAAQRAEESERADHLFFDPFARALAGEDGFTMLELSRKHLGKFDPGPYLAIRTRFIDDFVMRVASEGIHQVVILAAGMDARAFRLSWSRGTTVYELDRPELLELKDEILKRECANASCQRIALGVDLELPWTSILVSAGFKQEEPSLWICEGVLFYLQEQSVHDIFAQISKIAAFGSWMVTDLISGSFFTSPWTRDSLRMMEERGMRWQFGTDNPEALLGQYGWEASVMQPGEDGAHFGRWPYPVIQRSQSEYPMSFLITATKTQSR